jgi:hypothetical protein
MQYYWGLPMSDEDQIMAMGHLAKKRGEAKKQLALLKSNIDNFHSDLAMLKNLMGTGVSQDYEGALRTLTDIQDRGGLEFIMSNLEKYISLKAQVVELDKAAKDAGID